MNKEMSKRKNEDLQSALRFGNKSVTSIWVMRQQLSTPEPAGCRYVSQRLVPSPQTRANENRMASVA